VSDSADTAREAEEADAAAAPAGRVATIVVAIVFAVLYGYTLLLAVSNLVAVPALLDEQNIDASPPWPLLILGVVVPPVLYLAAVLLGRQRPLLARALLFAVGLGATNALFLTVATFGTALLPAFVG